jgi:integrase/recombinase XerD
VSFRQNGVGTGFTRGNAILPKGHDLYAQFVKERKYLKNVTEKTVYFYNQGWTSFSKLLPEIITTDQLSKQILTEYVIRLKDTGVKAGTINAYCRALNAFFVWLMENEYVTQKFRVAKLPVEKKVLKTLPENDLRMILDFKPETFVERRVHTLVLTILDTGLRIDEALSLKLKEVDFDNLIMKIFGKGRKERLIPFSYDLRKALVRYIRTAGIKQDHHHLFGTRDGGKVLYDNARRDYTNMCKRAGARKICAFHLLRSHFATNYLKNGGNVIYLKEVLGHSEISTTGIYVATDIEVLKETQMKTSILGRLKQ